MKTFSAIGHYLLGVPIVFGVAALSYPLLIWLALRSKSSVKATIWYRNSGFSIEARGHGKGALHKVSGVEEFVTKNEQKDI